MEELKKLGLNPIDEKQAENVNGGSIDPFGKIFNPQLIWCCVNIPPVDYPTTI